MHVETKKKIMPVKYCGKNLGIIHVYGRYFQSDDGYDIFSEKPLYESAQQSGEYLLIDRHTTDESFCVSECFKTEHTDRQGIMYLYFNVSCDGESKTVLNTFAASGTKIFLNGRYVSTVPLCDYNNDEEMSSTFVSCHLKKGTNRFIYEVPHPKDMTRIEARFSDYDYLCGNHYQSVTQIGSQSDLRSIVCIYKNTMAEKSDTFEFKAINSDDFFTSDIKCTVYGWNYEKKDSFTMKFGEVKSIRLSDCISENDIAKFILISLTATNKKGKNSTVAFPVIYDNAEDFLERIGSAAEKFGSIPDELSDGLKKIVGSFEYTPRQSRYLDLFNLTINYPNIFPYTSNKRNITSYDTLLLLCRKQRVSGRNLTFSFVSSLDSETEQYFLRIPDAYTGKEKYSLLINCATWRYSWESLNANNFREADGFIFADVSVKGATAGNFVGEALFFEILDDIKKHWLIDEDRIFITGSSNGGFAAWRLAEKYPHIFAGAYPLAGFPILAEINNLMNLPVIAITSDDDGEFRTQFKEKIGGITSYTKHIKSIHSYEMNSTTHAQLLKYTINRKVLRFFLRQKRNSFPPCLMYTTFKNRYRKAYWVTLHPISFGCESAVVYADAANSDRIRLHTDNSEGVSIVVPPETNRSFFTVTVNDQTFEFRDYKRSEIHFVIRDGVYEISEDYCEQGVYGCSKKGSGLLDVYFDRLTIVIPDNAEDFVVKAAENFRSPKSLVNDGTVYTKYPVISAGELEESCIESGSLIVFEFISDKSGYNEFSEKLPIKPYGDGFEYKGVKYNGKYAVMQIIDNPLRHGSEILHISYNSQEAFSRNYFLRNVVLILSISLYTFRSNFLDKSKVMV